MIGARMATWWKKESQREDCLVFTALEDGSIVKMAKSNATSVPSADLLYSVDEKETWSQFVPGTTSVLLSVGQSCYMKAGEGGNEKFSNATNVYSSCTRFSLVAGKLEVAGQASALIGSAQPSANYAFANLFYNCYSLADASKLEVFSNDWTGSNFGMFYGCSALTSAPERLPEELALCCYQNMFYGCRNLSAAPDLPATALKSSCYRSMFYKCRKLSSAPALPAEVLKTNCYNSMFYGCSSLVEAPFLPASVLADSCYERMFYGCDNLSSIEVSFTAWKAPDVTSNAGVETSQWLYSAASDGVFRCKRQLGEDGTISRGGSYCPENWKVYNYHEEHASDPTLDFTALEDGSKVCLHHVSSDSATSIALPEILYSLEEDVWKKLPQDSYIDLSAGQVCKVKASLDGVKRISHSTTAISYTGYHFQLKHGKFKVSGKASAMHGSAQPSTVGAFSYLFYSSPALVDASELELFENTWPGANACMFYGCSALTAAPSALQSSLGPSCYHSMFSNCVALSSPPELPALSVGSSSYQRMFDGCCNLRTAPELPATTVSTHSYSQMFRDCSNLTSSPSALPALSVDKYSYYYMFDGCCKLSSAPAISATSLSSYSCSYMFANCSSLPDAPHLPAQTGATNCYYSTFFGCSNLSSASIALTSWTGTTGWVANVASAGVLSCPVVLGDGDTIKRGSTYCPKNWTVVNPDAQDS